MTEEDAWSTLTVYARRAQLTIEPADSILTLRRTLAKVYQPRLADDSGAAMSEINACLDVLAVERDHRELCGEPRAPAGTASRASAPGWGGAASAGPQTWSTGLTVVTGERPLQEPWQVDPDEPTTILVHDFTDANYLRREIWDRASRFGEPRLYKAWSWDGHVFRKLIAVKTTEFALEELGRALLNYQQVQPHGDAAIAVFLTEGAGRATSFRLIFLRSGRACEAVANYDLRFDAEPDDPNLASALEAWLAIVRVQLRLDRTPRR